jgi:hypothetical protein
MGGQPDLRSPIGRHGLLGFSWTILHSTHAGAYIRCPDEIPEWAVVSSASDRISWNWPGYPAPTRRFAIGYLAYPQRTTGEQLSGTYPVPIQYLVVPYTTPSEHLYNTRRMRENHAYLWGAGQRRPAANFERREGHPPSNIESPTSNPRRRSSAEESQAADPDERACSKTGSGRGSMVPGYVQGGTRVPPDQPGGDGRGELYLGCLWWTRNLEP